MFRRVISSACLVLLTAVAALRGEQGASTRSIVSRSDRIYKVPVPRTEEGIPIGNGRMAALVWTTGGALKFQINRVEIFEQRAKSMRGSGLVDIELAGAGADVFSAGATIQHLSVFEGLLNVKGTGVNTRVLAWHHQDVIAIEVDDRRPVPHPLQIDLRRPPSSSTQDDTPEWQTAVRGGRILLTQRLEEGSRRASSAVAIALLGRRTLAHRANDAEVRIVSPAELGRVVILIASAETVGDEDVAAKALSSLDAAAVKSFDDLSGDTAEWWHAFWQQQTLAFADNDYYNLYLRASVGTGQ